LDASEIGREDEEPLVQSLSAMASHLIDNPEESLENSAEKDVFLQGMNLEHFSQLENQEGENQSYLEGQEGGATEEVGTGSPFEVEQSEEAQGAQMKSEIKTSNSMKYARPNPPSWFPENTRSTTTVKGLTTWSAINGHHIHNNNAFKGTVQKAPPLSEFTVSGILGIQQNKLASTAKPLSTTVEIMDTTVSATEMQATTKAIPTTPPRRKPPPYTRFKPKRPSPAKYIKPQPENVVAKPISSDDYQTTFKLVVPEHNVQYNQYNRPTKRPLLWPMNPVTKQAHKKTPFMRITKKPYVVNPTLKVNRFPTLTATNPTTPATTTPPSTTTVFLRNPTPLVRAPLIPISFSQIPFLDFVRSQIFPRIGLSMLSLMATSPLILSLLGAGAGRRRRDLGQLSYTGDLQHETSFEISHLINRLDKNVNPRQRSAYDNPAALLSAKFTTLLAQLLNKYFGLPLKAEEKNGANGKSRI